MEVAGRGGPSWGNMGIFYWPTIQQVADIHQLVVFDMSSAAQLQDFRCRLMDT